jgi:hypothetical protein
LKDGWTIDKSGRIFYGRSWLLKAYFEDNIGRASQALISIFIYTSKPVFLGKREGIPSRF